MTERAITPVILCGGNGTRLWPRSRARMPKPFLPLIGDKTLFQETLQRTAGPEFASPIVVVGEAHAGLVEEQSSGFRIAQTLVEPERKETAAAIALAALRLDGDALMLVCPSDHHIADPSAFRAAASVAADAAAGGRLACLGVKASAPETRFGYIRRGEEIGPDVFEVAEFVEKPDKQTAAAFLASGLFAWNAGIFAFRAADYLRELERFRPELADKVRQSVASGTCDGTSFRADPAPFAGIRAESVDRAVMENTDRAALVMAEMGWSDVGSWPAIGRMRSKDASGNALRGDVQAIDCSNLLVDSDGPRVRLVGVQDLIVVIDGDDILIASAEAADDAGKAAKS